MVDGCCSCFRPSLQLCNSCSAGDSGGAATGFNTTGAAKSVVDYFAVSCKLLLWVLQMRVLQQHEAAYSDHATLRLQLSVPAPERGVPEQEPQEQQQQWGGPPPMQLQFRAAPDLMQPAVDALRGLVRDLAAAAVAADAARIVPDLEGTAAWVEHLTGSAMAAAGMLRVVQGQPDQRRRPRHLQEHFGIWQVRGEHHVAQARGGSSEQLADSRATLRKALRRALRAAKALPEQRLELAKQTLWLSSPPSAAANPKPWPTDSEVAHHFLSLLGAEPPAQHPPQPPELPPPGGQQHPAADTQQMQHRQGVLSAAMHALFTGGGTGGGSVPAGEGMQGSGRQPATLVSQSSNGAAAGTGAGSTVQRVGAGGPAAQPAASAALTLITPTPKPGAAAGSLHGLRGIAVGTMPAKLFAVLLEERMSDGAEASLTSSASSLSPAPCMHSSSDPPGQLCRIPQGAVAGGA